METKTSRCDGFRADGDRTEIETWSLFGSKGVVSKWNKSLFHLRYTFGINPIELTESPESKVWYFWDQSNWINGESQKLKLIGKAGQFTYTPTPPPHVHAPRATYVDIGVGCNYFN
jgi:hypothetical protein